MTGEEMVITEEQLNNTLSELRKFITVIDQVIENIKDIEFEPGDLEGGMLHLEIAGQISEVISGQADSETMMLVMLAHALIRLGYELQSKTK